MIATFACFSTLPLYNYFTVAFFHCKRCAFIRSKPHYCQTQWFQRFFVGWLIMLGRGDSLSLQELCFQYVEAALLPNTLVSEVFCGLAHHVGKRWLSFIARAVLSLGRTRTIAKHTGFRGFLCVGSSCWEEVALFHCKSCAFIRSKPHYCQTDWFQMFFVELPSIKQWIDSTTTSTLPDLSSSTSQV